MPAILGKKSAAAPSLVGGSPASPKKCLASGSASGWSSTERRQARKLW
jgi:hypothetical protein